MTRKHYIALAAAIKDTNVLDPYQVGEAPVFSVSRDFIEDIARKFAADVVAAVAYADNPRFDYARFVRACGLTTEGK